MYVSSNALPSYFFSKCDVDIMSEQTWFIHSNVEHVSEFLGTMNYLYLQGQLFLFPNYKLSKKLLYYKQLHEVT